MNHIHVFLTDCRNLKGTLIRFEMDILFLNCMYEMDNLCILNQIDTPKLECYKSRNKSLLWNKEKVLYASTNNVKFRKSHMRLNLIPINYICRQEQDLSIVYVKRLLMFLTRFLHRSWFSTFKFYQSIKDIYINLHSGD